MFDDRAQISVQNERLPGTSVAPVGRAKITKSKKGRKQGYVKPIPDLLRPFIKVSLHEWKSMNKSQRQGKMRAAQAAKKKHDAEIATRGQSVRLTVCGTSNLMS